MTLQAAINACSDWAPGAGKVYLCDVSDRLGVSVAALAPRLLAAHRDGSIELNRADLVAACDADKISRSEISDGWAEYHFAVRR